MSCHANNIYVDNFTYLCLLIQFYNLKPKFRTLFYYMWIAFNDIYTAVAPRLALCRMMYKTLAGWYL